MFVILVQYCVKSIMCVCFVCDDQSDVQVPELMAFVLFISQQVFPVLHKFRYYNPRSREKIGNCAASLRDMRNNKSV